MPNLRASALLCGGGFALMIATAIAGNLMPEAVRGEPAIRTVLRIVFFGSFALFVIAIVPLAVNAVLAAQPALRGKSDRGRTAIVWVIWGLMALGALVAIPAAIVAGRSH